MLTLGRVTGDLTKRIAPFDPTKMLTARRLILWSCVALLAILVHRMMAALPPSPALVRIDSSRLRLGAGAAPGPLTIERNEPEELDFKTREEIFERRRKMVARHAEFIEGDYSPSLALFGQITDGKPWWGLEGSYCKGPGEHSIDGPSEETRFLLNPFLLLGVNENYAWPIPGDCFPAFPRPVLLSWDPVQSTATVTYDLKRFFNEWAELPHPFARTDFYLVNYNARDFGYNYVHISKERSHGVFPFKKAALFSRPVLMQAMIHTGGSCGYPGGCNNQSPTESDLSFFVDDLPAEMYCKLWKQKPGSEKDPADFVFIIKFQ